MISVIKDANIIDTHIGTKLRQLRMLHGMNQAEVAQMLGISAQQVQKYEAGRNRLSVSRLYEICCALSAEPSFFFDGLSLGHATNVSLIDQSTIIEKALDTALRKYAHTVLLPPVMEQVVNALSVQLINENNDWPC